MSLLTQFENHLSKNLAISKRNKLLVACSGGPDSVVLFHLLKSLQPAWKFDLALIHFNHKLRGKSSKSDEDFVRRLAKNFKVPFYGSSGDVLKTAKQSKLSLEESAREARYAFFCHEAKRRGFKKVLLAHTQEDQAETVLMRVLQGTGMAGLYGIRRKMVMKNVFFLRPLLDFSKKDLLNYAQQNKIKYRKDLSNESTRFLRNWIRLELLPTIQKRVNPRVVSALARLPEIVEEEILLLDRLEQEAWCAVLKRKSALKVTFNRSVFLALSAPMQFRIINRSLKHLNARSGLNFEAWKDLRSKLTRPSYRHSLPKDLDFALTPSKIEVYKKFPTP